MRSSEKNSDGSMEKAFQRKVDKILSERDIFRKEGDKVRTGVETEYFIVRDDLDILEDEEDRNNVIKGLDRAKKELGIDSIETATTPIYLDSLKDLEASIRKEEEKIKSRADEYDLELIRSGTNPFRPLDDLKLSEKEFFRQINSYYNSEGAELIGNRNKVDVGSSKAVSLISAIHTNLEASDMEDAVEKSNYIYMISPYISALSGNARFLEEKDTGLSDLRMILWRRSHSAGDREIGVLDSYYSGIEDYFERVGSWPFILDREEKVLSDSVSRFWKDSRIKFLDKDIVVESRIASTQPSIEEDVAVHAFCIGRTLYAQDTNEKLLDIGKVNENRENAMRKGLDSELYSSEGELMQASHVLIQELNKARAGLKLNGIEDEGYLDILEERIENGVTPSGRLAYEFSNLDKKNRKSLFDALRKYNTGDV